jgi:hypothetical protein
MCIMKDMQVIVALKEPRKAMGCGEKAWIMSFGNLHRPLGESGVWGVVKNERGEKESDEEGAEVVFLSRIISISTIWKGAGEGPNGSDCSIGTGRWPPAQ